MSINTNDPASSSYGAHRRELLLGGFNGSLEKVQVPLTYQIGLFFAALAMIALPLIYLSLIGAVSYATYWHAVENISIVQRLHARKIGLFLYGAPLFVGVWLVFSMVKPLLTPRSAAGRTRSLSRDEEPLLHEFVAKLCATVGAPVPSRIDVDCNVNASAHLRRGWRSFFGQDLVLTLGLPLVQGFRLDQLTGVLAHELGHFAQGAGMRLCYVIYAVLRWFNRVVNSRDHWDEQLEEAAKSSSGTFIGFAVKLAQGSVWASRKLLQGLMYLGHAISSYLSRQMEFDADRYQTRMVGADVFESTFRELCCLDVAHHQSLQEVVEMGEREGLVADNLPRLIAFQRSQLTRELEQQIGEGIESSKTSWADSHPADSERITSARREKAPPVFRSELAAVALFRDFAALAREETRAFYEDKLKSEVAAESLVSTDELLASWQELRKEH